MSEEEITNIEDAEKKLYSALSRLDSVWKRRINYLQENAKKREEMAREQFSGRIRDEKERRLQADAHLEDAAEALKSVLGEEE